MKLRLGTATAILTLALAGSATFAAGASAKGHSANKQTFTVCQHGCRYRTIHAAVKAVKDGSKSVIKVEPGTYNEGVQVIGHKYDGLRIIGTGKTPRKVILEGKNAHLKAEVAQNGIEGLNVDDLTVKNMWVRNYESNGIFIHADPGNHCRGFLMKDDLASFNRSYGLFAKHCIGGRITDSEGWGHGDSAFYIGETPPQKNPVWTEIDHVKGYENVLGYSGTNSKYVDIHDSMFYNNGAGVVPNTLDSELFQPNADGKIHDNDIMWNNFNYFLPNSPVKTVSGGLGHIGDRTINYPTGVGVALFGSDGWVVRDNRIFGNFFWGVAMLSNALDSTGMALSENNQVIANKMGRNGTDTNRFDFYNDGSGKGNCFKGNFSSTFDITPDAEHPKSFLYPGCPPPASAGTGGVVGDGGLTKGQVGELAGYVLSDPPCSQQDSWDRHSHPPFRGLTPIDTKNFGKCK